MECTGGTEKESILSDNALRKVRDLPQETRSAVELLLGRHLQEEETISIQAYPTHEAPEGLTREASWNKLLDRIDRTAARAAHVPEEEIDALIDEASAYVRRHRAA